MARLVFIPVSDELLFDHPERIRGPLVPYHPDMAVRGSSVGRRTEPEPVVGRKSGSSGHRDRHGAQD